MLSRIDDVASVEDIAMMVGLKLSDLMSILDRLADLGAVQLSWRPSTQKPAARAAEAAASAPAAAADNDNAGLKGEAHPAVQRALTPPLIQPYTEGELEEQSDLSEAHKRRVLVAFYGLEGKNYYQLLGLDPDADKKAVRSAYFELSRLFHPDSMFGKDLGSFKAKMEAVFKRLTEAYEVLGRNQRRKEYDEYLASTMTTSVLQNRFDSVESQVRALSTAPPQHKRPQAPAAEAAPAAASAAAQPSAAGSVSSASASAARAAPKSPVPQSVPDPRRISQVGQRAPATLEERKAQARERLRRSFAGSASQVGSTSAAVPNRSAQQSQPMATTPSERARVGTATGAGTRQSAVGAGGIEAVLAHLRRAKDAEAAGDLLGAAAQLQAALALQPDHKDLQAQYARVSSAVTRKLADNYEKQARYEEKQLKWAAAALSWERVADGRPESAEAARAVAETLLKASGDVTKAQRFATRAVDLAPHDPSNVVVLARVLIAAGSRSQARQQLEKAVKLDPQNAMIKDLLREVR